MPPQRQWHGFRLGVNYFPFSSLYRQEVIWAFRLLTESWHSPIASCFLLLFTARRNDSRTQGDSTALPLRCAHHQTSTVLLWRKAVPLVGTGILIIIPSIPGEAFIWRFQRTYPFPALCVMHKPYDITDMQARQLHCIMTCWVPKKAWHQQQVNQRHFNSKLLDSQYGRKPRCFLWAKQF